MNHLHKYTQYNYWANELLLNIIVNEISEDQLNQEIISSFSSLRKTVFHIWDAEFIWYMRLNGESLKGAPGQLFNGTFVQAKEKILKLDEEFIKYVSGIDEEAALKSFTYQNVEGKTFTNPVWQSIHHCMNHSTYHRGQIVTMLRQLGLKKLPSTDFITYCRQNP